MYPTYFPNDYCCDASYDDDTKGEAKGGGEDDGKMEAKEEEEFTTF